MLPLGTVLHGICHPIKISQHFPRSQTPAASLNLWQMLLMGVGPLPPFQTTLCKAESMHVTDLPWNLAYDRCSTNDEQTDLLPSCSAPSCWSLKVTSSLQAGCMLREAPPGLGQTTWDLRQDPGIEEMPRRADRTHRGTWHLPSCFTETSRNGCYS